MKLFLNSSKPTKTNINWFYVVHLSQVSERDREMFWGDQCRENRYKGGGINSENNQYRLIFILRIQNKNNPGQKKASRGAPCLPFIRGAKSNFNLQFIERISRVSIKQQEQRHVEHNRDLINESGESIIGLSQICRQRGADNSTILKLTVFFYLMSGHISKYSVPVCRSTTQSASSQTGV